MTESPYRATTRGSTSVFDPSRNSEPPGYIVEQIPGATEAREIWLGANTSARELERAAITARKTFTTSARTLGFTNYTDARAAAAPGLESVLSAEAAERQAAAAAKRALVDYQDRLVNGWAEINAAQLFASRGVELHAEAGALWERLEQVLKDRDEAFFHAGQPGLHNPDGYPTSRHYGSVVGQTSWHLNEVGRIVSTFPVEAMAAVADAESDEPEEEAA